MRIISLLFAFGISVFVAKAQLDQGFFTTYVNADFTESYVVYLPEDNTKDCFWVEYEVFENYHSIYGETGLGVCEKGKSRMQILFEGSGVEKELSFEKDASGKRIMTFYLDDGTTVQFAEASGEDDGYYAEPVIDEVYYTSDSGNLLTIFDDESGVGFSLIGSYEKKCDAHQIGGLLTALDENGIKFKFKDGSCELNFEFSEDGVKVSEKNCKTTIPNSCPNWTGSYYFSE